MLLLLSKAFLKSIKLMYNPLCHSWHCSMMFLKEKMCSVQPLTFSKTSLFLFRYSRNHAEIELLEFFFTTRRWWLTSWANVAAILIILFPNRNWKFGKFGKFGWSFCIELSLLAGNNWQSFFCVESSLVSCPWGFDWFLTINTWINPC